MQFDPTSLAKFPKGKKRNFQAIFLGENKNWGHFSPQGAWLHFYKKRSIHVQLGPIFIVNWLSKNKNKSNQVPYGENFVRLPQGKHPSMCYLVPFPSSICSREKETPNQVP